MVGRCKEMTAEEVQKYFRGQEMYEVKPDTASQKMILKNYHSPLKYVIDKVWRLSESGLPTDPLNLIQVRNFRGLKWLGNFSEVGASRFTVAFGIYDGEDSLEITDPDVATHVAVSCYYEISDKLDNGIEEERHPELDIQRRYGYYVRSEKQGDADDHIGSCPYDPDGLLALMDDIMTRTKVDGRCLYGI